MAPIVINTPHLDATDTVFATRELTNVITKVYETKFAELMARQLFPVSNEDGEASESIMWYLYTPQGVAKLIDNYASDLPRSDIKAAPNLTPIRESGAAYGFNFSEIRAASKTGKSLDQMRANATKRSHEQLLNTIAFNGDRDSGLPGLLNNPNITRSIAPADGTGNATTFTSKTADQIIRDMNNIANNIVNLTKGVEQPDTLLMPISQYNYVASTPRNTLQGDSILTVFQKNQPYIKQVVPVPQLAGAGTNGTDIMIAYKKSPDYLSLRVPMEFKQYPPEPRNLEFVINTSQRVGGLLIFYPLSISVVEGI